MLFPADQWSTADVAREVVYQAVAVRDWGETRTIAESKTRPCQWVNYYVGGSSTPSGQWQTCASGYSWRYHEINPLLGQHPSVGRVNTYFVLSSLAHIAVSNALPETWRAAWQYVTIGVEAGVVARNDSLGIAVNFPW